MNNAATNYVFGRTYGSIDDFETEYIAMLDYAIANAFELPSFSQMVKDNSLIKQLKDNGIWSDLKLFYFAKANYYPSSYAVNFYTLNWKNPASNRLYNPNSALRPNFITNKGFVTGSNDVTDTDSTQRHYFLTGFIPNGNMTQTNSAVFLKPFDVPSTYVKATIFSRVRDANNQSQLFSDNSDSNQILLRVFTSQSVVGVVSQATVNGHILVYRISSTNYAKLNNNTAVSVAVAGSGAAVTSKELPFLGSNIESGLSGSPSSGGGLSYFGILTGTVASSKETELYNILNSF